MAQTSFEANNPLVVAALAKELSVESIRSSYVGRFIGTSQSALVRERTNLKKESGDTIKAGLRVQLQGDGIEGDATLEGNEEAMQFYDDSVTVNQLRHAVELKGRMTEKRVPFDLRMEAKDALTEWFAERLDTAFFNQICGNTAEARTAYSGMVATLAPSTNRILRAGGAANDQSLTSSDKFDLTHINVAKNRARTASIASSTGPMIRPIKHMGKEYYVMFLHDDQVYDLQTNTSTGQWQDIQKAALMGGGGEENPIFTGALGIYNGVVLHASSRVTNGVNSSTAAAVSNTRRAVLCGAQAATLAIGGDGGLTKYSWVEDAFDYKNKFAVSAGLIFGMKKTRFTPADDSSTNAEDFGTIVVSTYAATPTAV